MLSLSEIGLPAVVIGGSVIRIDLDIPLFEIGLYTIAFFYTLVSLGKLNSIQYCGGNCL